VAGNLIDLVARLDDMTDQQLAFQALSDAQRILEEYLQMLDRLVEIIERPDLLVAVDRFQREVRPRLS
jgi:hypothetical protein